jgi:hypothetical protein
MAIKTAAASAFSMDETMDGTMDERMGGRFD